MPPIQSLPAILPSNDPQPMTDALATSLDLRLRTAGVVKVKWYVVLKRNGKTFLHLLELEESLNGCEVMRRILDLYRSEGHSFASWTFHMFHHQVIDTVELEWAPDTEAQYERQRVALVGQSRNLGLTTACGDPTALASVSKFARRHPEFVMPATAATDEGANTMNPRKAIFIHSELTQTTVVLLMIMLLCFLTGGLVAGYKLGRVDVAMGVTAVVVCTLTSFAPFNSLRK